MKNSLNSMISASAQSISETVILFRNYVIVQDTVDTHYLLVQYVLHCTIMASAFSVLFGLSYHTTYTLFLHVLYKTLQGRRTNQFAQQRILTSMVTRLLTHLQFDDFGSDIHSMPSQLFSRTQPCIQPFKEEMLCTFQELLIKI